MYFFLFIFDICFWRTASITLATCRMLWKLTYFVLGCFLIFLFSSFLLEASGFPTNRLYIDIGRLYRYFNVSWLILAFLWFLSSVWKDDIHHYCASGQSSRSYFKGSVVTNHLAPSFLCHALLVYCCAGKIIQLLCFHPGHHLGWQLPILVWGDLEIHCKLESHFYWDLQYLETAACVTTTVGAHPIVVGERNTGEAAD